MPVYLLVLITDSFLVWLFFKIPGEAPADAFIDRGGKQIL